MRHGGLNGETLVSASMESGEGEVAREVDGEFRDSELPRTLMHSITVVPVAVLEPDNER